MNETFFGGSAAATGDEETVQELASTSGDESSASLDAATGETAEMVGSEETATSVSEAVMPAFGLVRVEPDGSAVIAGSATPSGEVRIFANDDQIGAETAQASGDFAFVTDAPLPTGGVELRILDVETDRFADTSVVVVVQDDRTSEPLVIASAPGEASEILQGLDGRDAAAATVDEDASEDAASEAASENLAIAEAEIADPVIDQPDDNPAAPEVMLPVEEEPESQVPPADVAEDEQTVAASEDEAESPAVAREEQVASDADDAPEAEAGSVQEPVSTQALDAAQQDDELIGEQPAPSLVNPSANMEQEVAEPVAPEDGLSEDESDGVEDIEVADSGPVESPVQTVPADNERSPAATIDAADEPADASAAVLDPDPAVDLPDSSTADAVQPAQNSENSVAAAPQQAFSAPTIDAVEIDGDRNFFAGAGEDGLSVRLYVDNAVVGSTEVSDGRWLIEAIDVLDQESQRIRIDMLAPDGTVVGRAEVDFILELPASVDDDIVVAEQGEVQADSTAPAPDQQAEVPSGADADAPVASAPAAPDVAEPVPAADPLESVEPAEAFEPAEVAEVPDAAEPAEPAEAVDPAIPTLVGVSDGNRTATGLAIIRQGDNLWTIARRVYGEGIRYTQIFEANNDQIRDPDLIYPGQVFDLPGTDEVIGDDGEQSASQQ
ncbi:LysM domain-containing protein [Pelagibacterium halotolerans]|nr:LysM domain-containing protein [Pelagibacterium halotolerans]